MNQLIESNLTAENIQKVCRICLVEPRPSDYFMPINCTDISNFLVECTSVEILQDNDQFPNTLCPTCITELKVAYELKLKSKASDLRIRDFFTNQSSNVNEVSNDGTSLGFISTEEDLILSCEDDLILPCEIGLILSTEKYTPPKTPRKYRNFGRKEAKLKHQCDTCGKIFKTKQGLVQHFRIHSGERPYICKTCNKQFINGGHLHTHMRIHTGEKKHHCDQCPKAFPTAQQLRKHIIAIHTEERPYSCSFCPKRCASSSNLATHVRIHTGEKNYHCDKCPKAFSTKGQLLQHILTHTGQKPYECESCHKRFTQKAHLTRHLKTHEFQD